MFDNIVRRAAPLAMGLSLLTGCKAESHKSGEHSGNDGSAPYVDLGQGIYAIKGGEWSHDAVGFGKHLAEFKRDHPNMQIDRLVPADLDAPFYWDVVIETSESPDSTNQKK